jgi:hypothetical protein
VYSRNACDERRNLGFSKHHAGFNPSQLASWVGVITLHEAKGLGNVRITRAKKYIIITWNTGRSAK